MIPEADIIFAQRQVAKAAQDLVDAMADIHSGIPAAVYPEFFQLELALDTLEKERKRFDDKYHSK